MQLIIGNRNYSSWSLRAWLMTRAAGIACEEILIPLRQPDTRQKILTWSPSGRVPCLVDRDLAIWDSLAIAEYLAEYAPSLWPHDARARAVARAVSAEMHSGFTALREHMPMNVREHRPGAGRTPEVMADIARIEQIWTDCRARYGVGGHFLFGDFCIADAMFAPVCFRFESYAVALGGVAEDYCRTMLAQPDMLAWKKFALLETETIDLYDVPVNGKG